jgi:hypothetical protein
MFQSSMAFRDAEVPLRISVLEERSRQSKRLIADVQSELSWQTETQERSMAALDSEVAPLKEGTGEMTAQVRLLTCAGELCAEVVALKGVVVQPRLGLPNSLIVSPLPPLFDRCRAKRFNML